MIGIYYMPVKYSHLKFYYFCQPLNLNQVFRPNHSLQELQGIEEHLKHYHKAAIKPKNGTFDHTTSMVFSKKSVSLTKKRGRA